MKKLIVFLLLFLSIIGYSQVRHYEYVSEIEDTMVVINKTDLDKINTAFYRVGVLDSLNIVNEIIISELNNKVKTISEIVDSQEIILKNKDEQINNIQLKNKEILSDLEGQLKRTNRKKVFWESTTGLSIIAILFLVII